MFNKIANTPYPLLQNKLIKVGIGLSWGLFVIFILFFFKPLNLDTINTSDILSFAIKGGIVTSLIILFNTLFLPEFFVPLRNEMEWTIKKEVLFIIWNVLLIAIIVAFYSFFYVGLYNLYNVLLFPIVSIFAIAPFVITYVIFNEKFLNKTLNKEADAISNSLNYKKRLTNQQDELVEFNTVDGTKKIKVIDIIFLSETKKYVAVYFFNNGLMNEVKLRMSLKDAREQLRKYTAFYRCQKKWVINLDYVTSVSANARGYLLNLKNCSIRVPVSRSLTNEITNRLAK
ncbi:MAG: hypothetical protein RL516_2108 [Bacteroidota bacterium]